MAYFNTVVPEFQHNPLDSFKLETRMSRYYDDWVGCVKPLGAFMIPSMRPGNILNSVPCLYRWFTSYMQTASYRSSSAPITRYGIMQIHLS